MNRTITRRITTALAGAVAAAGIFAGTLVMGATQAGAQPATDVIDLGCVHGPIVARGHLPLPAIAVRVSRASGPDPEHPRKQKQSS